MFHNRTGITGFTTGQVSQTSQQDRHHRLHNRTGITGFTTGQALQASQQDRHHRLHNRTGITDFTTGQASQTSQQDRHHRLHNRTGITDFTTGQASQTSQQDRHHRLHRLYILYVTIQSNSVSKYSWTVSTLLCPYLIEPLKASWIVSISDSEHLFCIPLRVLTIQVLLY